MNYPHSEYKVRTSKDDNIIEDEDFEEDNEE
jgi:hypothetical protein